MLSIRTKILLTLVAAIGIVVGGMWLLTKWSFERGFVNYVSAVDTEMQENLTHELADEYQRAGSWDILRADPQRWQQLQFESILRSGATRMAHRFPPGPGAEFPPLPPPGAPEGPRHRPMLLRHYPRPRMLLLDPQKQPLIGQAAPHELLRLKPIDVDGHTVGFLGMRRDPPLSDVHAMHFTERQAHSFMLIAVFTMVVSTLLAWPLARQLVKPIRRLSAAARQLAAGNYETRVEAVGTDELGQLSRDFNSLANTLDQNERARRQWIADISHELRTPLSILQAEIEAMQDGVREVSPARLSALHAETLNLARLVNDLYELSLSDIGALSYHKERMDLSSILEMSVQGLRDEFADAGIQLEYSAEPGQPALVFGDPDRLQQLFSNLLGNSLRYTDPGGRAELHVATANGRVRVDLRDSAPGVAAEHFPRLFERLYRVEPSRSRRTGGAGLGLAICRNIVEAHNGRISAHPSPLGGLWIQVELPLDG